MFNWLKTYKRIKNLKKEDKQHFYETEADIQGRNVVSVKISSKEQAYSEFSPEDNLRLSSSLTDYITNESVARRKESLLIKVYSNHLSENVKAQDKLKKTIKSEFLRKREDSYRKLFLTKTKSIALFIIGLLVLALSIFLSYSGNSYNLITGSIEILAWVFIWEAADLFFFARAEINFEYLKYAKITSCDYEFVNENL